MRKYILLFLLVLISAFIYSEAKAQQKTIYITLDVSNSMDGAKYDLANYSVQVISVLNNKNQVNFIVLGNTIVLSDKGKYETIHLNRNDISKLAKPNVQIQRHVREIGTIEVFNSLFNKNNPSQEIFIIGDGHWEDDKVIKNDFLNNASSGYLRTTFLETLHNRKEETSNFELFLENYNIGKIYKVDSNSSIISAINTIAEEITGVSSLPTSDFIQSSNCISFHPEMDVMSLMILYQDGTPLNNIPTISSIENNGNSLPFTNLGNPSNEKFQTNTGGLMSSRVYEVNSKMSAGSSITICFSDKIDVNKLRVFPVVDVQFSNIGISSVVGKTMPINANSIGICKDNETAEINIEFSQGDTKLASGSIKKTKVTVISNGKSYLTKFDNGLFTTEIPLWGDTTTYQIESELKGYFRLNSGIKSIIKTECEPVEDVPLERTKLPAMDLVTMTLDDICRDGKISVQLVDSITKKTLDPTLFDIEVKNNYPLLFKNIRIEFRENNFIDLYLESRGCWCNCLMPDDLRLDLYSTPKNNQLIDGKSYAGHEGEINLKVLKTQPLWVRCKWLIISMILSLLLIWFFMKLIKKNRFAKKSKITFKSPSATTMGSLNPKYISTDFLLRKKGFAAWFNRWFNPFVPEQRTLNFDTIGLSLLYTASNSVRYVFFPKASYDESTMNSINYDEYSKHKYIKHDENGELEVIYRRGSGMKTKNILEYSYSKKSWNDIANFQNFLRLLILALGTYFTAALFLIIKSLI